jgi:hypothetical protein
MKTTILKFWSCCFFLAASTAQWANAQLANSQLIFSTNNGALTVTKCVTVGPVVIPDMAYGMPVVAIGDDASQGLINPSVTVGNNVTTIGNRAFQHDYVSYLSIGNSVTNIGDNAFENNFLQSVTIPNGVIRIGTGAFAGNDLSEGGVTIPNSVTSIEDNAFFNCRMTNVTIGTGLISIGTSAFAICSGLKAINVDPSNGNYSSVDGVLFNKSRSLLSQYPAGGSSSYSIPGSVTSIGESAFYASYNLTNITIPASVTNIGDWAFFSCVFLQSAFFLGNTPALGSIDPFQGSTVSCYYLFGKSGWGPTYGGMPAYLWNPAPQTAGNNFGVRSNRFGFNITGTTNIPIVVEATTNLAGGSWFALQVCTLTNGSMYFSDAAWTNYPTRLYRIRSP